MKNFLPIIVLFHSLNASDSHTPAKKHPRSYHPYKKRKTKTSAEQDSANPTSTILPPDFHRRYDAIFLPDGTPKAVPCISQLQAVRTAHDLQTLLDESYKVIHQVNQHIDTLNAQIQELNAEKTTLMQDNQLLSLENEILKNHHN